MLGMRQWKRTPLFNNTIPWRGNSRKLQLHGLVSFSFLLRCWCWSDGRWRHHWPLSLYWHPAWWEPLWIPMSPYGFACPLKGFCSPRQYVGLYSHAALDTEVRVIGILKYSFSSVPRCCISVKKDAELKQFMVLWLRSRRILWNRITITYMILNII